MRRIICWAASLLPLIGVLRADVTDPVGYSSEVVPAGQTALMPIALVRGSVFRGEVVNQNGREISLSAVPHLEAGESYVMRIRLGANKGLSVGIESVQGSVLTLEKDLGAWLGFGDTIEIHPEHRLGDLLDLDSQDVLPGTNGEDGDLVTIWDPETQLGRHFFANAQNEWIEVGHEAAGDRSDAIVPFASSLVYRRRAATPFEIFVVGAVPYPFFQRIVHVSPGRNVISAPFVSTTHTPTLADWDVEGLVSGDSAARADSIRITYSGAAISPIVYLDSEMKWREVGSNGDGGATELQFIMALDLQRRGPAGFLRLSSPEPPESRSAVVAIEGGVEVALENFEVVPGGVRLAWPGEAGAAYQVQTAPRPDGPWKSTGEPVVGAERCEVVRPLKGRGLVRILRTP